MWVPGGGTAADEQPGGLQANGPTTLVFGGSGHLDLHAGYEPACIDHQWEYKVTLRRVDAAGRALG